MKIFELERETGLDRATIRYYEKEGFITPARLENGYRDYSQEDRDHLLKIRLLRQLGMSLDRVRNLQQGSEDFSAALTDQIRILEQKIQNAEQAKTVCLQMRQVGVCYETLNARIYLDMLSKPVQPNVAPKSIPFQEPDAREEYHPVRRFTARSLDYWLIRCILIFLIIVIFRVRPYNDFWSLLVSYGTPFLAVPLMAAMDHFWGTTPGKWLLGIEVGYVGGGRLNFYLAIDREWNVLRYGYGFGIPFWRLWRMYKSYKLTADRQRMPWDTENRCEYLYNNWNKRKKLLLAATIVILLVMIVVSSFDGVKPKYRGDITVGQFSQNYNYLAGIINEDSSSYDTLEEDGAWNRQIAVIEIGGNTTVTDYVYETDNGSLRKIVYDKEWTDVFRVYPLDEKAYIPAMTVLLSQKGSNYFDLQEFVKLWSQNESCQKANFRYKNIEVLWNIEATDCTYSNSIYWSENNGTVSLHLEIIVH